MSIKTLDLVKSYQECQREKYKTNIEKIIKNEIRNVAFNYLKNTLKSPREINEQMFVKLSIDLIIEKELILYKRYLVEKFYKNNYKNIMYITRNYDFSCNEHNIKK